MAKGLTLAPRSLFGRNVLLIVLLIVLGQLVSAVLVRQLVLLPRLEQLAAAMARNIGAIRAGLKTLPPAQRSDFVDGFNQRARLGLLPADEPVGGLLLLMSPLERRFIREVSRSIASEGEDAEIIWRREAGGSLAVRLRLDGADHWVLLPGALPAREFSGAWVVASLISAALALLGAVLIQRRLNQPLKRVVLSARTLAAGSSPQPLPEDGPSEIAALSRSFNHLVSSLAQADHERALMLAGVSHDLRTPLTKLRLAVEIIRDMPDADSQLMTSMTRSIEEMDAIISQFLDFARAADAENPVPTDLNALAAEVVASSADHGQPVIFQPGQLPVVSLRPKAMRRVLANLIENAWRHGKPPVVLNAGVDAAAVWLEVCDHGPGISPAQAEALKQPFRRAETTRAGPSGAGLGLAIVDRVVQAHGGSFQLLVADVGGLRARIVLPL